MTKTDAIIEIFDWFANHPYEFVGIIEYLDDEDGFLDDGDRWFDMDDFNDELYMYSPDELFDMFENSLLLQTFSKEDRYFRIAENNDLGTIVESAYDKDYSSYINVDCFETHGKYFLEHLCEDIDDEVLNIPEELRDYLRIYAE